MALIVDVARLKAAAAGEGQEMPGEVATTRCGGADHVGRSGQDATVS